MEHVEEQHHKRENRHRHQQRDEDFADQVFVQCFHDMGRATRKCLILPANQAQLRAAKSAPELPAAGENCKTPITNP